MGNALYGRDSARRSLIDTAALRVVSQVATILSYVILVRGMPEEQFGVLSLLYSFIPVIGTVLSLGLEQVLQRYQPEYLASGNKVAAAWLVRLIASSRFATNVLMLAAVLLAWNYIAPLFKLTPYRLVFASFSFLILLHFQARVLQLALGSHMMHRYSVGSMTLLASIKLVVYGVLYWRGALTLEAAIAADTLAYACAYVSMRVVYSRKCLTEGTRGGFTPEASDRKRFIRYGLFNNFNDAGVLLLYSTLDNFFIAAYMDTLSVGIYSFYSRLRQMLINALPVKLFENVIRPVFFSIPAAQADQSIPRYFSFLLNMNLLLQWPALAFVTAYHVEIVQTVFGGKFIEESWLLPFMMAFGALNAVADPASLVAQYEEKAGVLLTSKLFAGYNVLAMIALVPLIGIYGAALAGGSAQTFKNAFIWWHVRKRAVWLNAGAALCWSIGLWGIAVAVAFAFKHVFPVHALVQLLLGAVVFAGIGFLYVRSPALSVSDRDLLRGLLGERTAKLLHRLRLLPSQP